MKLIFLERFEAGSGKQEIMKLIQTIILYIFIILNFLNDNERQKASSNRLKIDSLLAPLKIYHQANENFALKKHQVIKIKTSV
ncbi:hypothetical protein BOQ64_19515 [Chryseobacterium sp. CH25]|nr:hypothetical protein BOQ64_19515 [Chryseobacterium sp. CH25]RXM62529.1 hypothetical protein BOQ60_20705 [Chryseobacterium sp. CH1]